MQDQVALRVIAKQTIPLIILFGLYVITHGELGPGGGFQGGVIVAAGVLLYFLVFGKEAGHRVLPPKLTSFVAAAGVLLYAGTGVASLFLQGRLLDYAVLWPWGDPSQQPEMGYGEVLGMTLVEYGVGMTVASVMITIFNMITETLDGEAAESCMEDACEGSNEGRSSK